jgi:acetylornithine aminotransferase/acetylornithine/N-succinyldiaminopimelate aminotransferase
LACAVAVQLITILQKDKMLNHVQKVGNYMIEQLHKLQKKHSAIREIRGMGLMVGIDIESPELAKEIFQQLLKLGTIVNRTDETVIRLLPPFIIKKQHVDTLIRQLEQVLTKSTLTATTAAGRKT